MRQDEKDMRISNTRLVLFNFFNGTIIKIILNKRDGVEMGATHCRSALLSSYIKDKTLQIIILKKYLDT